jgi:hypothetical protein
MQTDRLLENASKTHKIQTGGEQGTICTQERVEKADNTTYRDTASKTHEKMQSGRQEKIQRGTQKTIE